MNELPDDDKMRELEEPSVLPEPEAEETAEPDDTPVTKPEEPEEVKPDEPKEVEPEQASAKKKKKRKKKTAKDFAIEFLIKIVITAVVVAVLLIFVVGIHVNHSHSSYPMIKDGDLVITYKLGRAQAGEEIAYEIDGQLKFGRIVAKEGDEVDITDSYLTVNGYGILEDVVYPTTAEGAVISFPYIVPQGAVFVLNDYRSDTGDSRTYGAIPLSDMEGEVVLILRRRGI